MSIMSSVQSSGVELIPAGKCAPWLKMTTTDRLNMDTASATVTVIGGGSFESTVNGVTQTGTSRTVPLDNTGRGRIIFDSGKRYNFHLNHAGNYTNDGDQQLDAESTTGPWVNWELMSYPSVSTVTTVSVTYQGAGVNGVRVVATSGSMNINGTTAANGNTTLRGLDTGTWTVSLPDYGLSQTLVVDMLMESVVFALGGIDATIKGLSTPVTITGPSTQTKTPVDNGTVNFGPLPAGTYTVSTAYGNTSVAVSSGVQAVTVDGKYHRWTARIAFATTDPEDRVAYLNDASGLTPASGHNMNSWSTQEITGYVAPCVVSNGVKTYLNKRNLTKTISGAASNIATMGNDAMVEFKKLYLALYTSGNYIFIEFSEIKIDGNFFAYAHTYRGSEQTAFYWGCYQMHVSGGKVYSVSGQLPYADISITNSIAYAKARGTGYDIMKWYHTIFVECLFVLFFKSTDGQTALARGLVSGSKSAQTMTTFDNDFGLAGSTSSTEQMAFLWVINFWGNCYQWVGGAKTNSSYKLMTILGGDSSVNESDFTNRNVGPSSSISGYISKVAGSADGGFFPTECSGSATTLWCDHGNVSASGFPRFGGNYSNGDNAGPFYWSFYYSATEAYTSISSRLSLSVGLA